LWVSGGVRVLRFDNARTKGNGAAADGVLGQADFTSDVGQINPDAHHFNSRGIHADATGRLWVNDYQHYRLLRFDNAAAKINGAPADGVLGQDNFTTANNGGLGPDGLQLSHMCVEPGGRLWAADVNRHRVLRWEHAALRPNGADADGLLGQPDFGFDDSSISPQRFYSAGQVARDSAGHLWIADVNNERILRFSPVVPRLALAQKNPTTLSFTCENVVKGVQYAWLSGTNLQSWQTNSVLTPTVTGTLTFDSSKHADPMRYYRLMEQ
jgi:sugar lactone lactonase YvrE